MRTEIRKASETDIPKLLPLMRELAEFEKYDRDFVITEQILRAQGFRRSPPDFHCLVAQAGGGLVGYVAYYFVPFTYRARPNLIIKELYVVESHRSKRIGEQLMREIANEAQRANCGVIKWWVAKWNHRSKKFYERLGARMDDDWAEFQLSEKAIRDLADW